MDILGFRQGNVSNCSPFLVAVLILSTIPWLTTDVHAKTKKQKEKRQETFTVVPTKITIVPKFTAGLLMGDAADKLEGSENTSVIGGGIALEYTPRLPSRLGLNLELVYGRSYKVKFDNRNGKMRSLSYSGSWLYLFAPTKRNSLFTRVEYGFSRLTPLNPEYYEPQTFSFLRLGFGNSHYSGSRIATRFELYYKRLFTTGASLTSTNPDTDIWFDVTYVGLEFSLSFSL